MKFSHLLCLASILLGIAAVSRPSNAQQGKFITLQRPDGTSVRSYVAGPADSAAGVLVVHDYFGISEATRESVEHLGALGYRALAIDLYGGKTASTHDEAVKLMQALDRIGTDNLLQIGLERLKRPGRKLATLGFSMGGQESLLANLNDPDAVTATAIVYGFGFDKLEIGRLGRLKSPVLVISGSEDTGAVQAAIGFSASMKSANRQCEIFIYPGVDHGYAQPLFNNGKNFNPEATRASWVVIDDFFESHLK